MIPSLGGLDLAECSLQSANQSLSHLNLANLDELDLSFNDFGQPIASCWFCDCERRGLRRTEPSSQVDHIPLFG